MGVLGSGLTGLGNVPTAGQPPGGGGGGGSGAGPSAVVGKFSGASGQTESTTTIYLTDDGDLQGGSSVPMRYPTGARTITVLRLGAPVGTTANPPTATLFKNGVATLMTCTLPAVGAAGVNVFDDAHPITFADGDTFDVQLTQPAEEEGLAPYVATLEGTGGNVGTGIPYDDPPELVLPPGGTPLPGVASEYSRGDHTHALADLLPFDFTGTYYVFDIDATGALNIRQTPATDGVDFDQHSALNPRRHFDTFQSAGLLADWQTQYTDVLGNTKGGVLQWWTNLNGSGARYTYGTERMYTDPAGGIPFQPGYSPAIGATTYTSWYRELLNAVGGGSVTRVEWNSDGGHFRKMLLPSATPHTYFGEQWAMGAYPGASAADGSAVALQVVGPSSGFGDNLEIGSVRIFQDSQNYGSAQVVGHGELWARGPALGGIPVSALSWYADHVAVPGYASVTGKVTALESVLAGLTTDPIGGVKLYAHDSRNAPAFVVAIENDNDNAAAQTYVSFATGLLGAFPLFQLNSHNHSGGGVFGGPEKFVLFHQPSSGTGAGFYIANGGNTAGADIIFTTGAGNTEVLRMQQADQRVKFAAGSFTANGGQAIAIGSTGPGAIVTPGAPAKWLTFRDSAGVLTYVPAWQ